MRVIHASMMTPYLKMKQVAAEKEKSRLESDSDAIPDILLHDKARQEYNMMKSQKSSEK